MKRRSTANLLIFLATIVFITAGTLLMIRYAKGYRPTLDGTIKGTGLLAANSFPNGAEVYINDRLTTATDTTINLDPNEYDVSIRKDGYFTWFKRLTISKELVTQTNATLFPTSPTLEPLTFTGAITPIPAPDGDQLAYTVASASASAKNGLYVQDLTSSPISLNRSARQIARSANGIDFASAHYTWSPNGTQIMVSFSPDYNVLLDTNRFNDSASFKNVTGELTAIFSDWEEELARQEKTRLAKLPQFFLDIIGKDIGNLYLSPNGEKLLYQAKNTITLPPDLIDPLPSSSTQAETRDLTPGSWYVYDLKEDKNFLTAIGTIAPSPLPSPTAKAKKVAPIPTPAPFIVEKILLGDTSVASTPAELGGTPSAYKRLQDNRSPVQSISLFNAEYSPLAVTKIQWYPDSYHLILTTDEGVHIIEYDNTNRTTVYAGPFDPSFVYPWPDGSKIITRIQFSPETIPNLYTIKLK